MKDPEDTGTKEMNVSVDDRRTVLYCHWNVPLAAAKEQFMAWGFVGVQDLKKVEVMNGNEARTAAMNGGKERGALYGWHGNYDWGLGKDSALYEFSIAGYHGDPGRLFDGAKGEK